ncbi:hypothetical protein A8U91_04395 [Halomonas elongata]|uniref:Uncharacterized protein n=1 Tax=Halomonas elongata TaxID=2746 RepID=A0A1B8NZE2_HALEL|nr:hypothetical protein A8U91_04395 [Halomonas elongata]
MTGLFAIIFVGWLLDREGVRQELQLGDTGAKIWTLVSRFIAPLGVIVVFVSSL